MNDKNPYHICTWSEESACTGCDIKDKVGCRLDTRDFRFFVLNQVSKSVVDKYLKKNPVMKDAWERCGNKLGG